jgi:cell division protease FtsH
MQMQTAAAQSRPKRSFVIFLGTACLLAGATWCVTHTAPSALHGFAAAAWLRPAAQQSTSTAQWRHAFMPQATPKLSSAVAPVNGASAPNLALSRTAAVYMTEKSTLSQAVTEAALAYGLSASQLEEADSLAAKMVEAADSGVAKRGEPNVPNLFAPHAGDVKAERRPLDLRAAMALDKAAEEAKNVMCTRRSQFGAVAAALAGASMPSMAFAAEGTSTPWAYSTFLEAVKTDQVEKVSFAADGRQVLSIDKDGNRHESLILPEQSADLIKELTTHNVLFAVQPPQQANPGNAVLGVLGNLAVPVAILAALSFLSSRGGGAGGMPGGGPGGGMNPFSVGKSKAKVQMEPQTGVTFEDVAGCDGSKLELNEIVEFLKNPSKFSALGAKIPSGVIMEGPPGTGKTLLARAVAGEAGVPFISTSASEFVEMFVGVGASRVRDLFEQAKKNAPAIVFIDEIDAIGRQRAGGGGGGAGGGGGNDEREQTLNQILTEMDGFEGNTGVIVIAATNRADVLDAALLRPGRFDRRVPVDLPDRKGREEILKVHVRGKPMASDVSLDMVAKRTIGFSGASLANLMNEAAIVAARRDKTEISYEEIDYAIDRQQVGMQKETGTSFPNRQRLVAYHEAGHALMGAMVPDYDLVTKVTIIPRTNGAGGFTLFTPTEERLDSGMYSQRYLEGQLAVALGGRVAEELVYGEEEITTGASGDLQQVRNIARRMVAQWGFAKDVLGATSWESPDGNGGFGPKGASPETEAKIDAEVKKLVERAYIRCKETLETNRDLLDEITETLIEKETINFMELYSMVGKKHPEIVAAQQANFPPEMKFSEPGKEPAIEAATA